MVCHSAGALATRAAAAVAEAAEPSHAAAVQPPSEMPWIPVFKGFVDYGQLRRSQAHRLRRRKPASGPHLIVMHGPDRQGRAETAVRIHCPSLPAAASPPTLRGRLAQFAADAVAALLEEDGEDHRAVVDAHFLCSLISLQQHMAAIVRCLLRLPESSL